MSEIAPYLPSIIIIVVNIVAIAMSFASLRGKVDVLSTRMDGSFKAVDDKFESLDEKIGEIKNNHLTHLDAKVEKLVDCINNHLQNHEKCR